MLSTVSRELHERLGLMRRALTHCHHGGFSFSRFLALAPERLRLAIGATATEAEVPVAITPALPERLASIFDALGAAPARPTDLDALRRTLRFAQLDPELDPLALGGWLDGPGHELNDVLQRVELIGLRELGRGAGGEALAYLVHLATLATLRDVLARRQGGDAPRRVSDALVPEAVLASTFVTLALAACAARPGPHTEPSLRLGLQLALTTSPLALGASADELAKRPVNVYRTTHAALVLARRIVVEPLEVIELDRVVAVIAERLTVDDETATLLGRDLWLELVRDAAAAAVMKPGASAADVTRLEPLVASIPALVGGTVGSARRRELTDVLRSGQLGRTKAADALGSLFTAADSVLRGDLSVLGARGDLAARARLAALGAVVLVLDEHAERARVELTRMIAPIAPERADDAWRDGRAYRIALDDRPLARRPRATAEAQLVVDLSQPLAAILSRGTGQAAAIFERELLAPILARVEACSGPGRDELSVGGLSASSVLVHGDVVAAVELLRGIAASNGERRAAAELRASDVRGGGRPEVALTPSCFLAFGPVAGAVDVGVPGRGPATIAVPSRAAELFAATGRARSVDAPRTAERGPAFFVDVVRAGGGEALHNEGCAMSGAALAAFEEARRGLVASEEHGLAIHHLPEDVREGRVFTRGAETFRVLRGAGEVVLLVRWVGALTIDPASTEPTDVWEVLDPERPLGRAIVDALPLGARP